jgi:hypothetical protein
MPGVVVHGIATFDWLEGHKFLINRYRTDHPKFPDSISIIGSVGADRVGEPGEERPLPQSGGAIAMHYYDSRGVFREYQTMVDDAAWRIWRMATGFSQRFAGTFSDAGDEIAGRWEASRDGVRWEDDLAIVYRRQH